MRVKLSLCLAVLFLLLSTVACAPRSSSLPQVYFPTASGTTLAFNVQIGSVNPLRFRFVSWPISEELASSYSERGYSGFDEIDQFGQSYVLELQVIGPANGLQGCLKYPQGVELAVVQDTYGFYNDASHIYWAFAPNLVNEVVTIPTSDMFAPQFAYDDGCSIQPLVGLTGHTLTQDSSSDPAEKIITLGTDTKLAGYEGIPLIHVQRIVKAHDYIQDYIDNGFTEDYWYQSGTGLVYLIQTVNGEISMTWTRVSGGAQASR